MKETRAKLKWKIKKEEKERNKEEYERTKEK
jgi:hypothetical protein